MKEAPAAGREKWEGIGLYKPFHVSHFEIRSGVLLLHVAEMKKHLPDKDGLFKENDVVRKACLKNAERMKEFLDSAGKLSFPSQWRVSDVRAV